MNFDSLFRWAADFGAGERLELICSEAPAPERGRRGWKPVRFPCCVAELDLHVVVELFALDVSEVAIHVDGCEHPEALTQRLEQWTTMLAMAGRELSQLPPGRARRPVLEADRMPTVERRAVLLLGRKYRRPDDAWRPDLLDTPQQRLRAALRELGAQPTEAGEAPGLGLQIVADGCESQGQCVRACPHRALGLSHEEVEYGVQRTRLTFDASLCDSCGRCVEFCDRDALSAAGPVALNALLDATPTVIADITTRRCERCRASFVSHDDERLCPVCAARQANPFGSSLPPEAIERLKRMRESGS